MAQPESKALTISSAVPYWWGTIVAVVIGLTSLGAYVTNQSNRIATAESRVDEQRSEIRDLQQFRSDASLKFQAIQDDVQHVKATVDRIADKLGVVR